MAVPVEDILIEISPGETRIAILGEKDELREFMIERMPTPSLLGGIYNGRVVRVEKGIGAAFLDIGEAENVFLDRASGLHEGENVIVQVFRDAAGGKPPSVRRRVVLVGRLMTFTPEGQGIHWPRSLKSGRRRDMLEAVISPHLRENEGWSVRTKTSDTADEAIASEMQRLRDAWSEICVRTPDSPRCLLPAPSLARRILRDRGGNGAILVDDRATFLEWKRELDREAPDLAQLLSFYEGEEPMFEGCGIADQLDILGDRRVELPRGGGLTFDRTEALTVIDVDMGSAGGRARGDDAILAVNSAAAEEAARQIVLRNLAGLIVIDFITMRRREHRRKLVEILKRSFRYSTVPVDVLGVTAAGLVEITRRRDGPPVTEYLRRAATAELQLSEEYLVCEAMRQILRTKGAGRFKLVAAPRLAGLLEGPFEAAWAETSRRMGGALALVGDEAEATFRIEVEGRS